MTVAKDARLSADQRCDIDDLYLRYVNAVDDGPLEQWPELFVDACSYQIISRENVNRGLPLAVMRCDSKDMLRDRVDAIRSSAFYVTRITRHLVGPLAARAAGEEVEVSANVAVFQSRPRSESTLLCVGRYDDVVVREGDALLFRQKHCIYDGDLVIDSIVHPL